MASRPKGRRFADSLLPWGDGDDATTLPGRDPTSGPRRPRVLEDDRPTEILDPTRRLHATREQTIEGKTIAEMIRSASHKLSRPLAKLMTEAKATLPEAEVDDRARLRLRHDFEFDRRVGYQLVLEVFDGAGRCVEVSAEVDHDGRKIRSGSMMSKLISI